MKKTAWQRFVSEKMGPYMKKYGSHGAAMKQIGKEWRAQKKTGSVSNTKKVRVKGYTRRARK